MKSKYVSYDDNILVEYARSGDVAAVTALTVRYLPIIRQMAAGYHLPGMESEDLIQEGFIGLLKAIAAYDSKKSSFKTFASVCVTASIVGAVKKALSLKSQPLNDYLSLSEEDRGALEDSSYSPEQRITYREHMAEFLDRLKNVLSLFEQQVLRLYLGGESYAEIAETLRTSPKAVDNALQRIRRKLRSLIKDR